MPFPPTDRLTSKILIDWLRPQIESGARLISAREPDMGRVIVVTMQPGTGLQMDGLFDSIGFQLVSRGAENNSEDAENIALEMDSLLIKAPTSFMMGDVYVDYIGRSGGGPQQMPFTDSNSRYVFTCNYYANVSIGLGG